MPCHYWYSVWVRRCDRIIQQFVVSSKSNEFKNKIEIIQSAFEKNMVSIETQFMAKIGTFEMFRLVSEVLIESVIRWHLVESLNLKLGLTDDTSTSGDKSTYCLRFYEMLAYLYANFAHSLRQTLSSYQ